MERWGVCHVCQGHGIKRDSDTKQLVECGLCNGQGYDGSGVKYLERYYVLDWDKDRITYKDESEY